MALIHAGSIKRGLNTIGVPNIMGSLILKTEGAINTRPSILSCLDLEKHIRMFRPSVAQTPPMVINAMVKNASEVTMLAAVPPAATASIFSWMATIKIGVVRAFHSHVEIPRV